MASFNQVTLIGNLTRDPELKYIPSGEAVCNLGLAVNEKFKKRDGSQAESVLFITCVAWKKLGENCAQYLKKGSPVLVTGKLKFRAWQTPDGQKRSVIEVQAMGVQFLSSGKISEQEAAVEASQGSTGPAESQPEGGAPADDEVPF